MSVWCMVYVYMVSIWCLLDLVCCVEMVWIPKKAHPQSKQNKTNIDNRGLVPLHQTTSRQHRQQPSQQLAQRHLNHCTMITPITCEPTSACFSWPLAHKSDMTLGTFHLRIHVHGDPFREWPPKPYVIFSHSVRMPINDISNVSIYTCLASSCTASPPFASGG